MRKLFLLMLVVTSTSYNMAIAQNKYGQTILCGHNGLVAAFSDTSRPKLRVSCSLINPQRIFVNGSSNICDSSTGKPLLYCNGMVLYDTTGAIVENGDNLVDSVYYYGNAFPAIQFPQGSLILPKGNNQYYVFVGNATDSVILNCWISNLCGNMAPYNELRYNVVDMNLNSGAGKVIVKNKKLLEHVFLNRTQMQAVKHANGKDWWLLKTGVDTNIVYKFLITADSIYGPFVQSINSPKLGKLEHIGQMAFGKEGSKYASVLGITNKLIFADFDRCTSLLENVKVVNIPIDSSTSTNPNDPNFWDVGSLGVSFSPNGKFIYIAKKYNVYQYEYDEPDSAIAWRRVKPGPDTPLVSSHFEGYGPLYNAPDGRMYVGKYGNAFLVANVIDHPNIKGVGCGWCNRCLTFSSSITNMKSFANMPDYNLGPTNNPNCWPVGVSVIPSIPPNELVVYPNPSNTSFFIKQNKGKKKEMYNAIGSLIITTWSDEIDVSRFAKGVYYIRCEGMGARVVVE